MPKAGLQLLTPIENFVKLLAPTRLLLGCWQAAAWSGVISTTIFWVDSPRAKSTYPSGWTGSERPQQGLGIGSLHGECLLKCLLKCRLVSLSPEMVIKCLKEKAQPYAQERHKC